MTLDRDHEAELVPPGDIVNLSLEFGFETFKNCRVKRQNLWIGSDGNLRMEKQK